MNVASYTMLALILNSLFRIPAVYSQSIKKSPNTTNFTKWTLPDPLVNRFVSSLPTAHATGHNRSAWLTTHSHGDWFEPFSYVALLLSWCYDWSLGKSVPKHPSGLHAQCTNQCNSSSKLHENGLMIWCCLKHNLKLCAICPLDEWEIWEMLKAKLYPNSRQSHPLLDKWEQVCTCFCVCLCIWSDSWELHIGHECLHRMHQWVISFEGLQKAKAPWNI